MCWVRCFPPWLFRQDTVSLTILRDGEVSEKEVHTDVILPLGDATTRLVLWCGALIQEMYPGNVLSLVAVLVALYAPQASCFYREGCCAEPAACPTLGVPLPYVDLVHCSGGYRRGKLGAVGAGLGPVAQTCVTSASLRLPPAPRPPPHVPTLPLSAVGERCVVPVIGGVQCPKAPYITRWYAHGMCWLK